MDYLGLPPLVFSDGEDDFPNHPLIGFVSKMGGPNVIAFSNGKFMPNHHFMAFEVEHDDTHIWFFRGNTDAFNFMGIS